jgi:hypothetical protein
MHTRHDDVLVVKMKKVDDKSGDVETECECVCTKQVSGADTLYRENFIVMITSAKLLHLPSLEIPFLPSGIIGWERMHQTETGKMPPNLGQFLVSGMRAARRFACVLQFGSRDGPADWPEIFNHGNRENWALPRLVKRTARNDGGVRSNVLDDSGPALEV